MAKKKTAGSPAPETGSETSPAAAARRRRTTTAKGVTSAAAASPDVANDRAEAMPEPAGQRVTPADASDADSVTFVSVTVTPTYDEIAEAAYHRYLNRGGGDGGDFEDWIEAEKSLKTR